MLNESARVRGGRRSQRLWTCIVYRCILNGMSRESEAADEVIDAQGVADMLGLSYRNAVSAYQKRYPDMPRPLVDPGAGRPRLWARAEVEEWMIRTGRMHRRRRWHRDPHYRDILDALAGTVDPDLFEDCVPDLLYPDFLVAPVPGGNDGGMDGAVFDGEGTAYQLITTMDRNVLGNLKRSLRSYLNNGGTRRKALLATSRPLTPTRRRNLEEAARQLGFTLTLILDRRGMADLLYRNPRWCRLLFGLSGVPLPFRPFPPAIRRLHHRELVGRAREIGFLLSGEGDQLLVGPPGSGKTAILTVFAQERDALFLHSSDQAGIANGLRTQLPTIIIVDDAHTHLDQLRVLTRLRTDLDLSYRIVASAWPNQASESAISGILDLRSVDTADVPELSLDQVVKVVRQAGVEGPADLVREIVKQARGLPGLAMTLTRACLEGGIRDVASGDAINREIRRVLNAQDLPNATQILAVLGIAGEMGMSLEDAAEGLGLSLSQVQREMAELATAGVLGQAGDRRWAVYPPALRHALVRDEFFGNSPTLPPDRFIERVTNIESPDPVDLKWITEILPDFLIENRRHKEVARTLIGVKRAGGRVPPHLLSQHLQRSESSEAWAEWAWQGYQEAQHALREHPPALLEHPRPFLYWTPSQALAGLLKAASQSKQAPHHTSKLPPLQAITKWVEETWQPDEALRRRRLVTEAAIKWGQAHPTSDLPSQVIAAVLSPGFEYANRDPGSGDKLTINSGILQDSALQEIASLWNDPILPFLSTRPGSTLRPVINAVSSWKHLSTASLASPSPQKIQAAQTIATPMISDLMALTSDHPGLSLTVSRMAADLGMHTETADREYTLMYGPLNKSEATNWAAAEAKRAEKARHLGMSRSDSEPAVEAARLASLETAALEAGHNWPRYTPQYAQALAQHSNTDPLEWVNQFVTADLHPDLLQPFLAKASEVGSPGIWETVDQLIKQPQYEWLAIHTIITTSDAPPLLENQAITRITPYTGQLEWAVRRDDINPKTIGRLLQHQNQKVASTVAIGIWSKEESPPSGTAITPLWRRAILQTHEDQKHDYQLGRILASDQDLAFEWLAKQLTTSPTPRPLEDSPTKMAIDSLDEHLRIRLLPHLQPKWLPHQTTAMIVGTNPAVYRALLKDQTLQDLHLAPLEGYLERDKKGMDEDWTIRVKMALERGYTPDQIARATFPTSFGWEGPESQMWESWIPAFQALPSDTPDFQAIQAIGIETAQDLKDNALAREHKRRVYGNTYAG